MKSGRFEYADAFGRINSRGRLVVVNYFYLVLFFWRHLGVWEQECEMSPI